MTWMTDEAGVIPPMDKLTQNSSAIHWFRGA